MQIRKVEIKVISAIYEEQTYLPRKGENMKYDKTTPLTLEEFLFESLY